MAKKKIKPGQVFLHTPSGGTYLIVTRGQIKIPHVGWFKSVTYKDAQGNHYTRFLEDFENKFIRKPKSKSEEKIITSANPLDVGKALKDLEETVKVKCIHCNGNGWDNRSRCMTCDGSGIIQEVKDNGAHSYTEAANIVTKPV